MTDEDRRRIATMVDRGAERCDRPIRGAGGLERCAGRLRVTGAYPASAGRAVAVIRCSLCDTYRSDDDA